MRHCLPAIVLPAVLLILVLAHTTAYGQCGAFCLYEVGHPLQGASTAGAGAAAQDASTAFFNPAGMTRLDKHEILLGTNLLFSKLEFNLNQSKSTLVEPTGQINDGGDAGGFAALGSSYAVLRLTDDLRAGFALNGVYGGNLNYNDDWVGRTYVTDVSLSGLNIEPTLAYRLTDWLSVGAGLNIYYTVFNFEARLSSARLGPTIKIDNADDWSVGGTFGILVEPSKTTRIGIVYRTPVDLKLGGDFENPSSNVNIDVKFKYVQGVNVSIFHQLTPTVALLADAGWSDWSEFSDNTFVFSRAQGKLDRDWNDTWRLGVGVQYQVLQPTVLRAGFSYDSSPVKASRRLPDLPVDEQYRFSVGVHQDLSATLTASVNYTFVWNGGKTKVDEVTLPTPPM